MTDAEAEIRRRIDALLLAYSRKDVDGVLALCQPGDVFVFGSDVSEVAGTEADVADLLRADFGLWESSRFGEARNLSVRVTPNLATAFFDAPFEVVATGQVRQFVVRFATTWKREGVAWLLTQAFSATATVGQSAADLSRGPQ